ncbi:hypothetical protein GJAV_G00012180, partial [Gymnothorax javanicus]
MADGNRCSPGPSHSASMSSLGRALSHSGLNQMDRSNVFLSQTSIHRASLTQQGRRSRLSSSNASMESPEMSPVAEARVLVINTGGTIGMMYHNNVLCPEPNAFVKSLRKLPILHDEQYAQQTRLYDFCSQDDTLVLPLSKRNKRIVYTVLEYCPLLDSCNMTTDDWAKIGKDIEVHPHSVLD